jgi:hypothetical protein
MFDGGRDWLYIGAVTVDAANVHFSASEVTTTSGARYLYQVVRDQQASDPITSREQTNKRVQCSLVSLCGRNARPCGPGPQLRRPYAPSFRPRRSRRQSRRLIRLGDCFSCQPRLRFVPDAAAVIAFASAHRRCIPAVAFRLIAGGSNNASLICPSQSASFSFGSRDSLGSDAPTIDATA